MVKWHGELIGLTKWPPKLNGCEFLRLKRRLNKNCCKTLKNLTTFSIPRVKSKLDRVRLTQKYGHNSSLHRWRLRLTQKFGQNSSLHRLRLRLTQKFGQNSSLHRFAPLKRSTSIFYFTLISTLLIFFHSFCRKLLEGQRA